VEIDFSMFAGKKIMVVNVASACGYTPQYQQRQELDEAFEDKLVVVGIPCNDFGGQEPGDHQQIQTFCSTRYGVSFPMAAKLSIKGAQAHSLYQWLGSKALNGVMDTEVRWNFHKYLLDEKGKLVKSLPSAVEPFDDEVLRWLQS
jgi:glutathione peroxidase